jgi:uncharacterized membrane protein
MAGPNRHGKAQQLHLTKPGILLGLGFGGLFDGILLHQILQWHHMLTSMGNDLPTTVRGLQVNTLADGLFHAVAYAFLVVGLVSHWRHHWDTFGARRRHLLGWILTGWGIFNLVEGIIDHHILRIHHVRPGPNEFMFDMSFLALGAFLLVVGASLGRSTDVEAR